jgi:phospholipid-translocating ATPase
MLLWVVIYSFIPSSDFDDEVIILFGELTFWTTVVFSVFVALGQKLANSIRARELTFWF